jgi:rRNA processing protein Krr1/Pno1
VTIIIVFSFLNSNKSSEKKPESSSKNIKSTAKSTSSKKNKKKSKAKQPAPAPEPAPAPAPVVVEERTLEPTASKNKKKKKKKGAANANGNGTKLVQVEEPKSEETPAPKATPAEPETVITANSKNKKKKNKKNNKVTPEPEPTPLTKPQGKKPAVKKADDEDDDSDDEMDQAVRLMAMKQKSKGTGTRSTAAPVGKVPATKSTVKPTKSSTATAEHTTEQESPPEVVLEIGPNPTLLIGPGGSTIQRITATSGARLDILKNTPSFGQNSVRITIGDGEDPTTCIAKAVEMVQALLDEQAAIMANSKTVTLESSEINGQAGVKAIIGRSGQTIQSILQACNENSSNGIGSVPGQSVKINANVEAGTVEISGPKALVDKAVKLCKQAVFGETQATMKLESRSAMNLVFGNKDYKTIQQLQSSTGAKLDMDKETFTLKISGKREEVDAARAAVASLLQRCKGVTIDIKAADVGAVYGKGGSTIRNIQDKTGAIIEVQQQSSPSDSDAAVKCVIMGEPDAVTQARQLIAKALAREVELKPGQVAETLNLGGATTAAVIGRGGSKIKELETAHSVSLNVNGDVCKIVGNKANVKAAKEAIETIIEPILAAEAAQKQATIAAETGDSAWQGFDIPPEEDGW